MGRLFTVPMDEINPIGLLPPYFQSIKDFIALMETERIELTTLQMFIMRVYDNLFIQTCDEDTLRYHEQLLGIFIQPGDTLDERRLRILNRYNTVLPITLPSLKLRLNNLLGVGNWKLDIDYPNYTVSVTFLNVAVGLINEAVNMLLQTLPAHLLPIIEIVENLGTDIYIGASIFERETVILDIGIPAPSIGSTIYLGASVFEQQSEDMSAVVLNAPPLSGEIGMGVSVYSDEKVVFDTIQI